MKTRTKITMISVAILSVVAAIVAWRRRRATAA